jgi:type I site-specific restriction endonuclease
MEDVDKKELSERDICTKFITPAIKQANWNERQIREDVKLTNGRIIVKARFKMLIMLLRFLFHSQKKTVV